MVDRHGDEATMSEAKGQTVTLTLSTKEPSVVPEELQIHVEYDTIGHSEHASFRLLDLPRELRDLIFQRTVTIDTLTIQDASVFDPMGHTQEESDRMY